MKVVYGKIKNLQYVDAMISELPKPKKVRAQAGATALVSIFSESGGMGAAATLGGANGEPGYYIYFCIDHINFYAALTSVFFKEDEDVYVVYDENVEGDFNVLAVMNKNNKLLGISLPFGETVEMVTNSHSPKNLAIVASGMSIFMLIISLFLTDNGTINVDIMDYVFLYACILVLPFVVIFGIGASAKKELLRYALISDQIYKLLGVKDLKVFEKRDLTLAYHDVENRQLCKDIHDYTQFLDYDPQPLVDVKTN
ncbi:MULTISPECIES: putative type VI secretion system effector [Acinetobacter]|uniref:putative type VI secretion system effector n=1 Tax=Acinetobacter TaxID=469 RepID=UPI00051B8A0C|nr:MULTISPECIES: putative type VI secretion system effector [Acinetobacter]MCH7378185.1 transposase [Acinetobacter higginsii]MCJ0827952.1 transposase [Acinetobacter sp. NIPH1876]